MKRYGGLEGLRAWLAWTVVFSHISALTGLGRTAPWLAQPLARVADLAVMVFIAISGFVITHLIQSKPEPYRAYIARRFMRIYPVYLVALIAGIGGTYLAFDAFGALPWGDASPPNARLLKQADSLRQGDLIWHLAAHLSMLHGAVSSKVLYESQYMFLGPAWSLSLEWQFYLLAPLAVGLAKHRLGQVLLVALALWGHSLYAKGALGQFFLPSVLPGAVLYFGVGMATRFLLPNGASSPLKTYPLALLALGFGFFKGPELQAILVWAAFVAMMLLDPQSADVMSRFARRAFAMLFDTPWVRRLGALSYATYLIHMPILQLVSWYAIRQLHLGPGQTLCVLLGVAVPLILLASRLLHQHVELPGMALVRRRQGAQPSAGLGQSLPAPGLGR